MSLESMEHLNTFTVIGFTDKRGTAWHYRADLQGAESNHYPGAIPAEDVLRRLFAWTPREGTVSSTVELPTIEGITPETFTVVDASRKSIVRPPGSLGDSDKGAILGVFKTGYRIHSYDKWLLENVNLIASQGLPIGSAGLLRGGAQAWVSFEVPDNVVTPEGVTFRPNLLAATSLDGTLATTYQRVITNVVCDNTMSAALSESTDQRVKVRHSRNSLTRLADVRDALGMVESMADDFAADVARFTNTDVTDAEYESVINIAHPLPEEDGNAKTRATNTQAEFRRLWKSDPRVAPWTNTAWGVIQAFNTYEHHLKAVRGGGTDEDAKRAVRASRNMERAVRGEVDSLDAGTLSILNGVLTPA